VYYQERYQKVPFLDVDIIAGAGAIVSNVLDYAKWLKAMIDASGPISKEGHRQLKTSRTFLDTPSTPLPFAGPLTYALGWITGVYRGHQFYYHSGGLDGFGAEALFVPDLKYGITLLGNTATTSNIVEELLMWYLVDEKLRTPQSERFDWSKKYNLYAVLIWDILTS
jgi:CubicO group peptidase (beta-lactamase class C family)